MLFAAVGIHPNEALTWEQHHGSEMRMMFQEQCNSSANGSNKIVAVGEIGLDYYRERAARKLQRKVLLEMLSLAAEIALPVILHMREEADSREYGACTVDLMTMLEEWVTGLRAEKNPLVENPGVLHSFNGSTGTAEKAMDMKFLIGVNGPVTFQNAQKLQSTIRELPLKSLLIETDAPFLTPRPHRGQRNEPAYVHFVARKVAELQSREITEVAAVTTVNAAQLFRW